MAGEEEEGGDVGNKGQMPSLRSLPHASSCLGELPSSSVLF